MKKRILSIVAALACTTACALTFVACGGGAGNSIKVSLAQFSDRGITNVSLYYLDIAEVQRIEEENEAIRASNQELLDGAGVSSYDELNAEQREYIDQFWQEEIVVYKSNKLYQSQDPLFGSSYDFDTDTWYDNVYTTAKLDKGSYSLFVTLSVPETHRVGLGELTVNVNDEDYPVFYLPMTNGMRFGNCYVAFITQEISASTEIKLQGHTTAIPFTMTMNLQDDPEANYLARYDDAILFKCTKNGGEVLADGVKASELYTLLDGKDFDDVLDFVAYDAPGYEFVQNVDFVSRFFGVQGFDYDGRELKWTTGYSALSVELGFSLILFDYTIFSYVD